MAVSQHSPASTINSTFVPHALAGSADVGDVALLAQSHRAPAELDRLVALGCDKLLPIRSVSAGVSPNRIDA